MSNKHASLFNHDLNYKSEKIFSMGPVMELILASNYDVSYQQKKVVENVRVWLSKFYSNIYFTLTCKEVTTVFETVSICANILYFVLDPLLSSVYYEHMITALDWKRIKKLFSEIVLQQKNVAAIKEEFSFNKCNSINYVHFISFFRIISSQNFQIILPFNRSEMKLFLQRLK